MLLSLHVKNLALIKEEEVEFTKGLNILTGETGAGKSIILGSVNLALGGKADKAMIRTGEEYALVELVFSADRKDQLEKLKELNISPEEDGTVLVKRKIYAGRSVCTIQGETVTLKQLRDMSECLIDVYGQRENQRLLRKEAQLGVIDEFAGEKAARLLSMIKEKYREYRELKNSFEADDLDNAARAREIDILSYEVNEIEQAALKENEDEELEREYRRLSNFRKISEAVRPAGGLSGEGGETASFLIDRALRSMRSAEGIDDNLDELTSQLSDIDSLLSDFDRALSDYMDDLSFDPAYFNEVEERLDLINHLKDKYGRDIASINEAMQEKCDRLTKLSDYDASRKKLKDELEEAYRSLAGLCRELTDVRRKACEEFEIRLKAALMDLNFNQVEFKAELVKTNEPGANGEDSVTFYISMNPGEALRPLEQIASGGELSRIMLALKTVFAGKDDIDTFIFDEIDSGISGQTAWQVARKLGILSEDHQILCITHLPQIAAMEDSHYLIRKETDGVRTQTHIVRLDEEASTRELGRLLGTAELTDATIRNAEDMKQQARKEKHNDRF